MQKKSTLVKETDLKNSDSLIKKSDENMQPSKKTLQLIMQFAANYRTVKVDVNQYFEMYMS